MGNNVEFIDIDKEEGDLYEKTRAHITEAMRRMV
jgi:hypothetical protein